MFIDDTPPLTRGELDRDARTRENPELLAVAWSDATAQIIRVQNGLLETVPHTGELKLLQPNSVFNANHAYLGRAFGNPLFVEIVTPVTDDDGASWAHPFVLYGSLTETMREAVTVAIALARWHSAAAFSPQTGEITHPDRGGWARTDASNAEYFPRTDPAVIVCIEHENKILLGSNVLWEAGRFSLLAGFVEAGESAESAVVREVREEAGIVVTNVRYIASQPWPYPRSLMLGFRATLSNESSCEEMSPDPEEISELRWFSRDELRDPPPGIRLPQEISISRWLIDSWVAEGDSPVATK